MVLKNREILNSCEALSRLDGAANFPAGVAFSLVRNLRSLEEATCEIENARERIAAKYGVLIDNSYYSIPEDKREEANKELAGLLEATCELNISTVPLASFGDIKISLSDMSALYFMISGE